MNAADQHSPGATPGPAPIAGVIFDFHHTLVQGADPQTWLDASWPLTGRAGSPRAALGDAGTDDLLHYLDHFWEHARIIDPDSARDLEPVRHREVWDRTIAGAPVVDAVLADALYSTLTTHWDAYDDAVPVLKALRDKGVRLALLSNVGYDLRPSLARLGLDDLVDGVVLSCELGVVKPATAIFQRALDLLGTPASQTLMVGDAWQDDGAAAALGVRTLILPRTEGPVHGLELVLRLVA